MSPQFRPAMSMKIVVPVKRVVDGNVRVRLRADGTGIETANVAMSMNPFDAIAVEAAVQLKEAGRADAVVAVSIGSADSIEALRGALAMGATRALLIRCESALEPLAVAKILKAVCEAERPDLVIAGKQAIDDDAAQTGPMLAALLGWGQATCAYRLDVGEGRVRVQCESDDGLETIALRLPAVVTTDLRLNEPRYQSLAGKMKARKMAIEEQSAADFGVDTAARLTVLKLAEPKRRPQGVRVKTVAEMVERLAAAGALP